MFTSPNQTETSGSSEECKVIISTMNNMRIANPDIITELARESVILTEASEIASEYNNALATRVNDRVNNIQTQINTNIEEKNANIERKVQNINDALTSNPRTPRYVYAAGVIGGVGVLGGVYYYIKNRNLGNETTDNSVNKTISNMLTNNSNNDNVVQVIREVSENNKLSQNIEIALNKIFVKLYKTITSL